MLRKPRWLLFAAIVVVLALVGLAGVSVATVRRSFPQTDGEISLPGLTAPVEVLRDDRGVAHLYADNAEDLFEAQGYVHAQDRFFEMDVRRHITAGRLSELFGPRRWRPIPSSARSGGGGWRSRSCSCCRRAPAAISTRTPTA